MNVRRIGSVCDARRGAQSPHERAIARANGDPDEIVARERDGVAEWVRKVAPFRLDE
ncbi:MAG: hypothetical protein ABI625_27245 [bacterium]